MSDADTLRRASPADAGHYATIGREVLGLSAWTDAQWASALERQDGQGWVVESAGVIVGVAYGTVTLDQAELDSIAVLAERQRGGRGSRLLEQFLKGVRERGAKDVFLEVRADNAVARAFYLRHGFVETGRRRAYYKDGSDALLMHRAIS